MAVSDRCTLQWLNLVMCRDSVVRGLACDQDQRMKASANRNEG
jgi:hypothetical protein